MNDLFNPDFMIEMINARMPYGKYEGRYITEIPVHYLEWMQRKGFPKGTLGQFLSTMYEVKTNGLMEVLLPLYKYRK